MVAMEMIVCISRINTWGTPLFQKWAGDAIKVWLRWLRCGRHSIRVQRRCLLTYAEPSTSEWGYLVEMEKNAQEVEAETSLPWQWWPGMDIMRLANLYIFLIYLWREKEFQPWKCKKTSTLKPGGKGEIIECEPFTRQRSASGSTAG